MTSHGALKKTVNIAGFQIYGIIKDFRAHCYFDSLVRTLFIRHAHATSFSSTCTGLKTQQNTELMTFALTWCANIFVGCLVNVNASFICWLSCVIGPVFPSVYDT